MIQDYQVKIGWKFETILENSGKLCNPLILDETTLCKSLIWLCAKKFFGVFKTIQKEPEQIIVTTMVRLSI